MVVANTTPGCDLQLGGYTEGIVAPCNQNPFFGVAMKRTSFAKDECPVARSLETVGDWWSLLIIRDAFVGKKRFGEFQRSLGVAKNILTVRLKKLVADGVLEMAPASDGSAYSEYVLTDKGRRLFLVIVALGEW